MTGGGERRTAASGSSGLRGEARCHLGEPQAHKRNPAPCPETLWEPRVKAGSWGNAERTGWGPGPWPCLSPATHARKGQGCTPLSGNMEIEMPIIRSDHGWWGSSGKVPEKGEP